jgi:phenylacetate-CoA ligase
MGESLSRRTRLALTARMIRQAPREARFPFRQRAAIQRAQERRVRATVVHAYRSVPYYRETMRNLGLTPDDFRCVADLARLPLLEREDLQRDPECFVSGAWPPAACVPLRSGGSTGMPVTFFRDPPSLFADAVQRERLRPLVARLAGRRLRYREAFVGPPTGNVQKAIAAFRRSTLLPASARVQRRTFSTFHSPAELLPDLELYRPDVIAGFGSYLDALFLHLRATGVRPRLPRVARFGGDAVSDAARLFAQEELGIEVLGAYNAIETPLIGFECEAHRGYHLNVDLCPIRLVGADGHDAAPGEGGEVVVSNLVNRGTVLLNYRLGDRAAPGAESCPCGRNLPILSLEGRVSEWIDLGEGQVVHPQAARNVLVREPTVWRHQLVQEERQRFVFRLVVSPECDREAAAQRIETRFLDRFGHGVAIRVEFVADLPRGPNGKVKPIVALAEGASPQPPRA